MPDKVSISVDPKEFREAVRTFVDMDQSLNSRWVRSTQRRNLKPIANDMKSGSKSTRIAQMIGITTAKRRASIYGAKVGVVKNDPGLFPKFSAPALASVIEYGTDERFRNLKTASIITGRQSTGEMPMAPFLRPAWDRGVNAFMNKTVNDIEKKVMEAVR